MTILTESRPATHETVSLYRGRPLVVRLRPRVLEIKEKGRRDVLVVDYGVLYEFALKLRWKTLTARPDIVSEKTR